MSYLVCIADLLGDLAHQNGQFCDCVRCHARRFPDVKMAAANDDIFKDEADAQTAN